MTPDQADAIVQALNSLAAIGRVMVGVLSVLAGSVLARGLLGK
jgi:hypothetical protein